MVYLQHQLDWCNMKLLPSRRVLCTPYNTCTVSLHAKPHTYLAITCTFGKMTGVFHVLLRLKRKVGAGGEVRTQRLVHDEGDASAKGGTGAGDGAVLRWC